MKYVIYSIVGWSLIGLSFIIFIDLLIPVFLRIKDSIKGTCRQIFKNFLGIYRRICKISFSDVLRACKIILSGILSGILAACKAILIDYPTRFIHWRLRVATAHTVWFVGTFQVLSIAFALCLSEFGLACQITLLEVGFYIIYLGNIFWAFLKENSQLVDFIEHFMPFANFWFISTAIVMNIIGAVVISWHDLFCGTWEPIILALRGKSVFFEDLTFHIYYGLEEYVGLYTGFAIAYMEKLIKATFPAWQSSGIDPYLNLLHFIWTHYLRLSIIITLVSIPLGLFAYIFGLNRDTISDKVSGALQAIWDRIKGAADQYFGVSGTNETGGSSFLEKLWGVLKGFLGPKTPIPLGPEDTKEGDKPKTEETSKETMKFETEERFNDTTIDDFGWWLETFPIFNDPIIDVLEGWWETFPAFYDATINHFGWINNFGLLLGDPIIDVLEGWWETFPAFYDAPDVWQFRFQDPASSSMEGILLFNKHILFVITVIVLLVSWIIIHTILSYNAFNSSNSTEFYHDNNLEIVWTSIPALVLLSLASPSFSLLYSMDEVSVPNFSIKILGHQWFWTYEISDFKSCLKTKTLKYACYMLTNEDLSQYKGFFRVLETNKRVILPTNTHMRLLVSAVDVLHSWTIPAFGLKIDACPGRLNQMNLFIKRFGVFFGQCSEICGINHGFMPIVLLVLPLKQYHYLIMTNLENYSE